MSTRRGAGTTRTRKPKHQNTFAFRHNPKSQKTAKILASVNEGLCSSCHEKVEWKKRYRKYRPLRKPATCNECHKKTITAAYHKICMPCARERRVCPWCCTKGRPRETPGGEDDDDGSDVDEEESDVDEGESDVDEGESDVDEGKSDGEEQGEEEQDRCGDGEITSDAEPSGSMEQEEEEEDEEDEEEEEEDEGEGEGEKDIDEDGFELEDELATALDGEFDDDDFEDDFEDDLAAAVFGSDGSRAGGAAAAASASSGQGGASMDAVRTLNKAWTNTGRSVPREAADQLSRLRVSLAPRTPDQEQEQLLSTLGSLDLLDDEEEGRGTTAAAAAGAATAGAGGGVGSSETADCTMDRLQSEMKVTPMSLGERAGSATSRSLQAA